MCAAAIQVGVCGCSGELRCWPPVRAQTVGRVRARAGRFEFYAKALYTDREGDKRQQYLLEDSVALEQAYDGGWVFTPGVILHLNERLGFKLGGEFNGNDSALSLGARLHF